MGLYSKLAQIQKDLISPKGKHNDYGGFFYRSCEDILQAVKPLLTENNCTLFLNNSLIEVGGRVYVNAKAILIDIESGEKIEVDAQAREDEVRKGQDCSQLTGASSSYARKYALAGLFCIDNEKDSDATNNGQQEEAPAAKPKRNNRAAAANTAKADENPGTELAKARARILGFFNRHNYTPEAINQIAAQFKVNSINDLSIEQCKFYIAFVESKGGNIDE